MSAEVNFYQPAAIVSFALLGLWWVVVRSGNLARTEAGQRLALDTSLYFVFTGLMSLLALSADDSAAMWRTAFGIASVAGIAAGMLSIGRARRARSARFLVVAPALGVTLYALTLAVALAPDLAPDLLELRPLQFEALCITLLLGLGASIAWLVMMRPELAGASPHADG